MTSPETDSTQAKGKEAQRGPAYHQRLLPAHTQLKVRYGSFLDANEGSDSV